MIYCVFLACVNFLFIAISGISFFTKVKTSYAIIVKFVTLLSIFYLLFLLKTKQKLSQEFYNMIIPGTMYSLKLHNFYFK